jgi:hypothetical protein
MRTTYASWSTLSTEQFRERMTGIKCLIKLITILHAVMTSYDHVM